MKLFINLPSLSLIVADVPERLRGSTRNRIRNACVGSNPAVCALLFFFVRLRRGERMDGCCDRWMRFDLWKRRRQKKRKISKKKKEKKNIIATKLHHLLVRTSRKEVRERSLSLSPPVSLERVARFLFLGFSTRGNASFFPRFFFRARDHTHRTREWWVEYPRKKNKKNA